MTIQNYLMLNQSTNVVDNIIVWDGGSDWTPPNGYTMLVQSTTPAMVWELNTNVTPNVYQLSEQIGVGGKGFTWNGTVLTTNHLQPEISNA